MEIPYQREPSIPIYFLNEKVGIYRQDFIADDKVIIEIKVLPNLNFRDEKQLWYYLKGTKYKIALLVNFGSRELQIKRWIYDSARKKYE